MRRRAFLRALSALAMPLAVPRKLIVVAGPGKVVLPRARIMDATIGRGGTFATIEDWFAAVDERYDELPSGHIQARFVSGMVTAPEDAASHGFAFYERGRYPRYVDVFDGQGGFGVGIEYRRGDRVDVWKDAYSTIVVPGGRRRG